LPRLPNPHRAVVDVNKLRDYCLNPRYEDGKHKARVFASALGLRESEAPWLREQLLVAAFHEAQPTAETRFGSFFVIDFEVTMPSGQATVRSNWIVRYGEDFAPTDHLLCENWTNAVGHHHFYSGCIADGRSRAGLTRGQIGTVVEQLRRDSEEALLVEFSDGGETYAIAVLTADQVIPLHRRDAA
jgi:hypothetical protein